MENQNLATLSWLTLAIGVILIVAPLLLGFPAGIATSNSLISGLLVTILSLAALRFHSRWEAWGNLVLFNLVLGSWVFISPLLFHFNTNDAATWIYDIGGIALMALATVQMWRIAGQLGRVRPPAR
jgi:O-antigen/teichoic acid export membrane protein